MLDANKCLKGLGKARFWSKMDFCSGFWQIPLMLEASKIAAFVTQQGLYKPTVMPFGLTNVLATFQCMMDEMMGSSKGEWSWVHMDDLLVYSTTLNDHLNHLEETFRRIQEQGLYVKLMKCKFARAKMEYLGHIISNKGI